MSERPELEGAVRREGLVHQAFEARVSEHPDRMALRFGDEMWSYRDLNRRANRIAAELRELGAGPNVAVGVSVRRTPQLIAALLGVLKSGAAYVALEPGLPAQRLEYMASDAGVTSVVCDDAGAAFFGRRGASIVEVSGGLPGAMFDQNPAVACGPEDLAYVLYTSGSTGRPKGVMLQHRAVRDHVAAMNSRFDVSEHVALHKTPYGFDVSVPEIFQPLTCGGHLVIASLETDGDPEALAVEIERHQISDLRIVPALLSELIAVNRSADRLRSLRRVICAGEALPPVLRNRFHAVSQATLWNLWGPTEATVYGTYWQCRREDPEADVPIGYPLEGKQLYVLRDDHEAAAVGEAAELYVGGDELAVGYRNKPRETAAAFVPSPFTAPGSRLYRSGDLARFTEDGWIDYLGRRDRQVQVHGVRIEPGEVEARLEAIAGVRQAAVRPVGLERGSAQMLAGYVVAETGAQLTAALLREELAKHLSFGAIPTQFVFLDELPMTPSGKIDRNALPEPEARVRSGEHAAASTHTEESVAAVWRKHLGLAEIGVHDNLFEIGGHSLLVARMRADLEDVLGRAVALRQFFETPTIAALAAALDASGGGARDAIVRHDYGDEAPLSAEQRRMWFLQSMQPDGAAYNEPVALRLRGALDADALRRAVARLVDRHEVLRTVFFEGADEPRQRILPAGQSPQWEFVDVADDPDPDVRARQLVDERIAVPFDLAKQTHLRVSLVRTAPEQHVLLLLFHHCAIDEWTIGLALGELGALYEAELGHRAADLPPLPVQYADYAIWQNEQLRGPQFEQSLAFWRDELAGAQDHVDWPMGSEPSGDKRPGGAFDFTWDVELGEALRDLARRRQTTLFSILHAAFAAFLARLTGQRDVTIGVPVTMRERAELQGLVGLLLNTVPMRAQVPTLISFDEWASIADEHWRAAAAHRWVPLEEIVKSLDAGHRAAGLPLFDVMFSFVPQSGARETFAGLATEAFEHGPLADAKTALSMLLSETDGHITGRCEFDAARFGALDVERLVASFGHFLRQCLVAGHRPIAEHGLLDAEESATLVDVWAKGLDVEVPATTAHALFEERARQFPDAVALIGVDGVQWTYRELDQRANRLAHALRDAGVGPDVCVGIHVERSPALIMAFLGTLKAGGAYVPLEPHLPDSRLHYITGDSGIGVVVSDAERRDLWGSEVTVVTLADHLGEAPTVAPPAVAVSHDHLCYVLYTSGTTGRPKGVMISHGALVNHSCWHPAQFGLGADDVCLLKSPATFDASTLEIYPILHAGGTLVCTGPQGERDPRQMAELIEAHGVTVLWAVPIQLAELLHQEGFTGSRTLRRVFCGGEAWGTELRERFFAIFPDVELHNGYGPTEACIFSTTWRCVSDPSSTAHPIGKPVGNFRAYVVDGARQLSAIGSDGELLVGGPGLARGYQAMPRRTAEAFEPDPFGSRPGARLYRTGDVVRWNEAAEIEYRSRRDEQVQLQGVRTELGEVEAVIARAPGVGLAAVKVVALGDGGNIKALAAYVVAQGADLDLDQVRDHVRSELPDVMVPRFWTLLDEMPRSSSDKIDRQALPDPGFGAEEARDRTPPRNDIERKIAQVWSEQLGIEEPSVHANFFELGGHSLLAVRVRAGLADVFGFELPLRALFDSPTVAALAAMVSDLTTPSRTPVVRRSYAGTAPLSSEQRRMWFLQRLHPESTAYQVPYAVRLSGFVDAAALEHAVQQLVDRHEVLRTVFPEEAEGPVQKILPPGTPVSWELLNVGDGDTAGLGAAQAVTARIATPFDLARDLPIRASLLRVTDEDHVLLLLFHHIAIDEWTTHLALDELRELYEARLGQRAAAVPALPIQYADYAFWQADRLQSDELAGSVEFWRDELRGAPDHIDWPVGTEPSADAHPAGAVEFRWDAELSVAVRELARARGTTLFSVLHALFVAYLARFSGQRDLTVGLPVTTREHSELQALIGFLLNTVPMRSQIAADASFDEWLTSAAASWQATTPHQWVPLEEIVQATGGARSGAGLPLFDVMFTYVPGDPVSGTFGGARLEPFDYGGLLEAKTALIAFVSDDGACLKGSFEYDAARFERQAIEQMVAQFGHFAKRCVETPTAVMSGHDLHRAADVWERTPFLTDPALFHRMFEAQVCAGPDRVAVRMDGGHWTYAQLNARANRLAHRLRELGVGPDVPVGVSLERSGELVAALLGVLKAGGAYVALEPSLPRQRLAYMIDDARLEIVVCDEVGRAQLPDGSHTLVEVDDGADPGNLAENIEPEHLAYVLYTSGTTGNPKGVLIPHRALAGVSQSYARHIYGFEPAGERRTMLLKASYTFDMFVAELFPPLAVGMEVAVAPPGSERDPAHLGRFVREHRVTDMWATPSALKLYLEAASLGPDGPLSVVYSGGEALTGELSVAVRERWGVRLWNLYGPTEMCIGQTATEIDGEAETIASIGRATPGHRVAIVDEWGEVRSAGVDGEVLIAGFGEARGYQALPGRTARVFVPAPGGAPGGRAYATGDIGRCGADGAIAYRGRRDDQLQVRGVRVELGDVEAHIESCDGVAEAAVRAVGVAAGRADALVAYVVLEVGHELGDLELREHLRARLPDAVIPGAFMQLERLPRMPSGKIDRKALPDVDTASRSRERVAPRTETERIVAASWCRHLGLDEVGVHENLFELGGHSLLAVRIVHDISTQLELSLAIQHIFEAPTVAGLAQRIENLAPDDGLGAVVRCDYGAEAPLSADQRGLWFLQKLNPESSTYHVPLPVVLRGPLRPEVLRQTMQSLMDRHEILRTLFVDGEVEPVQRILQDAEVPWRFEDLRRAADPIERATERVRAAVDEPFRLDAEVPFRVLLLQTGAEEYVLLLLFHHIALDFWTADLVIEEVEELYEAHLQQRPARLEIPRLQYADYTIWQREAFEGAAFQQGIEYWQRYLDGARDDIGWTFGYRRPQDEPVARYLDLEWDEALGAKIQEFGRRTGASLFVVFQAALAAVLARTTEQDDVTIGNPVTMRSRPELQRMVGLLLNTVPTRARWSPQSSFTQWVRECDRQWREAMPHHWIPMDRIVQAAGARRHEDRMPLFDVLFTYVSEQYVPGRAAPVAQFGGVAATPFDFGGLSRPKVAITFVVNGTGPSFGGGFEYDGARFSPETIEQLGGEIQHFVAACVASPDAPMGSFPDAGLIEKTAQAQAEAPAAASAPEPADGRSELQERLAKLPPDKRAQLLKMIRERQAKSAGVTPSAEESDGPPEGEDTVVRLQAGTRGVTPLVVVHAVGGTLFDYHGLITAIDDRVPVLGLQSPGLLETGTLPDTVEGLAKLHARAIRHHIDGDRCRLAGWSFGGVVGFELARELRELGIAVERLYLLDSWAPEEYQRVAAQEIGTPFDGFAFNLAGAFGVTEEHLEALRDEVERLEPHDRLAWLAERLREWSGGRFAVEVALLGRYYETFQGHVRSYSRYVPPPVDVATTLVVALENAVEPEARGWRPLLGDHLHIERLQAGHFDLLRPPHVAWICRLVEDEIAKEKVDV